MRMICYRDLITAAQVFHSPDVTDLMDALSDENRAERDGPAQTQGNGSAHSSSPDNTDAVGNQNEGGVA